MDADRKELISRFLAYDRKMNKPFITLLSEIENIDISIAKNPRYKVSELYKSDRDKMINHAIENKVLDDKFARKYLTTKGNQRFDMMGMYIFYRDELPVYVGRSKGMINRLHQHVSLGSHNTSSFGFGIAKFLYFIENKSSYCGSRKEFPFKKFKKEVRSYIKECYISFHSTNSEDHELLYLLELYVSMRFRVNLNKFETH